MLLCLAKLFLAILKFLIKFMLVQGHFNCGLKFTAMGRLNNISVWLK